MGRADEGKRDESLHLDEFKVITGQPAPAFHRWWEAQKLQKGPGSLGRNRAPKWRLSLCRSS